MDGVEGVAYADTLRDRVQVTYRLLRIDFDCVYSYLEISLILMQS